MAARHRRTHVSIALLVALVLVTALTAACSAQATSGALAASGTSGNGASASGSPAASGGSAAGKAGLDDWGRTLSAIAWMRANQPTKPVVVLLGGSAARESTISDDSWRKQIVSDGGPATLAWNMGSHNRTMAQNLAIVKALPQGIDAVVYVGINLGSFTSTQKSYTLKLPPAPAQEPSLQQPHQYGVQKTGIKTTRQKQAMVQQWISQRYPVYKANFGTDAALLVKIIQLCHTRGYKPVLLELPRNTPVIGSSLNTPTAKFRSKCAALAKKYASSGCKWVSFVSQAKVPNPDFYDIWHLVEPGRTIWQKLLSAKTAALLKQYGYDGGS